MFSREVVSDSCDPIDCSPQAPLSMGFSRQEDWGRIKPVSPALAGGFFTIEPPGKCFPGVNYSLLKNSVPKMIT